MTAYVLIQNGNADTHWTSLFLRGINEEAKARGMTLVSAESDGITIPDSHNDAKAVLAIGSSLKWIHAICSTLRCQGKKPILVGCANQNDIKASGFSVSDYERATTELLDYFKVNGKHRVALFAPNSDSAPDMLKVKAFLKYNSSFSYNDVFFFRGQTKNVCESFIPLAGNYDAVISANDVAGTILTQTLEKAGISVPSDLFLASFGDINYRKNIGSKLTVALLDCVQTGKAAIDIYNKILKKPYLSYITMKMNCDIEVSESTGNIPFSAIPEAPRSADAVHFDIFSDTTLTNVMLAEKILAECDALDIEIMRGVARGMKNADIAELLHASESTVKYRLKRLVSIGNLASRADLMSIMETYL